MLFGVWDVKLEIGGKFVHRQAGIPDQTPQRATRDRAMICGESGLMAVTHHDDVAAALTEDFPAVTLEYFNDLQAVEKGKASH